MTMPAVFVIYGFSVAYYGATGIFFFQDAYIPIAVFLGLHLLFTDPATSPRSELGRVFFGVLYGSGVVASVFLLNAIGAPLFYDKLLPVPILNVLAPRLDRLARSVVGRRRIAWAASRGPVPARRRFLTAGTWAAAFTALSLSGGVGDDHPGQYYPFWHNACIAGSSEAARERACDYMGFMQQNFCDRGSGWGVQRVRRLPGGGGPRLPGRSPRVRARLRTRLRVRMRQPANDPRRRRRGHGCVGPRTTPAQRNALGPPRQQGAGHGARLHGAGRPSLPARLARLGVPLTGGPDPTLAAGRTARAITRSHNRSARVLCRRSLVRRPDGPGPGGGRLCRGISVLLNLS